MKTLKEKTCQAKSAARSWDELISFTKAKIHELQDSLAVFEKARDRGDR